MLEECCLAYKVIEVDITAGDQFDPKFLSLSPNKRIPAIEDDDGPDAKKISVFESGAILVYLAEKAGKLLPLELHKKYTVIQWLVFQISHLGPVCGQAHHFREAAPERVPYAMTHFTREAGRLYALMDNKLLKTTYLAGEEYSIADIACWPWVRVHRYHGQAWEEFPRLKRWFEQIAERPAVQAGMNLLAQKRAKTRDMLNQNSREILFGKTQMKRH